MNYIFTVCFAFLLIFPINSFSQMNNSETKKEPKYKIERRVLTDAELEKVLHYNKDRDEKIHVLFYVDNVLQMEFKDIQSKPCHCDPKDLTKYNFVNDDYLMVSLSKTKSLNEKCCTFSLVYITEKILEN